MRNSLLDKIKARLKIGTAIASIPLVLAFWGEMANATLNKSPKKINSPAYAEEVITDKAGYKHWRFGDVWYSDVPLEEYSVPAYIFDSTPYDSIRMNPFYQPNDSTLSYYGSGDLNNDNQRTQTDLDSMFAKKGPIDKADIDGDSTSFTLNDYNILFEHINNDSLLPSDWNQTWEVDTPQGSWLEKMKSIDKTDTITYTDTWKCGSFSKQTTFNFNGFKELKDSLIVQSNGLTKYDFSNNGRFNIPMFYTTISSDETGLRHAIVTTLTKDGPLNLNNWYFIEPQDDLRVGSGDWSMPNDAAVKIYHSYFLYYEPTDKTYFIQDPFIEFQLTKGMPELVEYDERLILKRPVGIKPNKQNLLEKFVLNQNYPNPFNSGTTINYSLNRKDKVKLQVYDLQGKLVETLVNEKQRAGEYKVDLNSSDLSSGIYLYRLETSKGISKVKKMTILK